MIVLFCRVCGCSDAAPCFKHVDSGVVLSSAVVEKMLSDQELEEFDLAPCSWIQPGLCSFCVQSPAPPPLLVDLQGRPLRGAP